MCIAEGPGGFMEALNNYRKTFNITNDNIYGITLKSVKRHITTLLPNFILDTKCFIAEPSKHIPWFCYPSCRCKVG